MGTITSISHPPVRNHVLDQADPPVGVHSHQVLAVAVVGLLAVSSLAGLLVDGLYRESPEVVAIFRGYDLATLVAAVPLLAITLIPPLRASSRARLVTAGVLVFVVYDYAYYVFGTAFNDLFLLHVAVFSTALFALILTVLSLSGTDITTWLPGRSSARAVAVILGLLAVSLAGLWVSGALGFAFNGTMPDDGNALISPIELTHLGYAMDLALLVPTYALAAVWLWRRRPGGHVLGAVVLIGGALTQVTYVAGLVFQSRADVPGAVTFDPFAPVIFGLYVLGAALLLKDIRGRSSDSVEEIAPLT